MKTMLKNFIQQISATAMALVIMVSQSVTVAQAAGFSSQNQNTFNVWQAFGLSQEAIQAGINSADFQNNLNTTLNGPLTYTLELQSNPGFPIKSGRYNPYTGVAPGDYLIRYKYQGKELHLSNLKVTAAQSSGQSLQISYGNVVSFSVSNQDAHIFTEFGVLNQTSSGNTNTGSTSNQTNNQQPATNNQQPGAVSAIWQNFTVTQEARDAGINQTDFQNNLSTTLNGPLTYSLYEQSNTSTTISTERRNPYVNIAANKAYLIRYQFNEQSPADANLQIVSLTISGGSNQSNTADEVLFTAESSNVVLNIEFGVITPTSSTPNTPGSNPGSTGPQSTPQPEAVSAIWQSFTLIQEARDAGINQNDFQNNLSTTLNGPLTYSLYEQSSTSPLLVSSERNNPYINIPSQKSYFIEYQFNGKDLSESNLKVNSLTISGGSNQANTSNRVFFMAETSNVVINVEFGVISTPDTSSSNCTQTHDQAATQGNIWHCFILTEEAQHIGLNPEDFINDLDNTLNGPLTHNLYTEQDNGIPVHEGRFNPYPNIAAGNYILRYQYNGEELSEYNLKISAVTVNGEELTTFTDESISFTLDVAQLFLAVTFDTISPVELDEESCNITIPSDAIVVTGSQTISGSNHVWVKSGGVVPTSGGSNVFYIENGGSVTSSGGSNIAYVKNGGSINFTTGGSNTITHEPNANIVSGGTAATISICPFITFTQEESQDDNDNDNGNGQPNPPASETSLIWQSFSITDEAEEAGFNPADFINNLDNTLNGRLSYHLLDELGVKVMEGSFNPFTGIESGKTYYMQYFWDDLPLNLSNLHVNTAEAIGGEVTFIMQDAIEFTVEAHNVFLSIEFDIINQGQGPGNQAGITVTPTSGLTTSEAGGTATFTIALNTLPTANVTIGLSSLDTTEGTVSPATLTFTPENGTTAQTVTITGIDDALVDGNIVYSIATASAVSTDTNYNGLNPSNISVTNIDNDSSTPTPTSPGTITVAPTTGLTTTEASGSATFTISLSKAPTADVIINLSSNDTTEGTINISAIAFNSSNWNNPVTVTVQGVDDTLVDGSQSFTILIATAQSNDPNFQGVDPDDVTVTNQDNDGS
ncbi:MAG: hypothetical protein Q8O95_04140, partial [bacterium]|nr:hypothetical protein [bacterium]